jgi:hypothetical protein
VPHDVVGGGHQEVGERVCYRVKQVQQQVVLRRGSANLAGSDGPGGDVGNGAPAPITG